MAFEIFQLFILINIMDSYNEPNEPRVMNYFKPKVLHIYYVEYKYK